MPNSPYSLEINNRLKKLYLSCNSEGEYVSGLDISEIIGNNPYWYGFKNSNIKSDHWHGSIYQSLVMEYCTTVIKGGMATRTGHSFTQFHLLENKENVIVGLVVDFTELDIFEIPNEFYTPWNNLKEINQKEKHEISTNLK